MWSHATFLGGGVGEDISGDYNIPTRVARVIVLDPQSSGHSAILPPANRLATGWSLYLILNEGAHSIALKDNDGGAVATIPADDCAEVGLEDNSTAAGTWHARVEDFAEVAG